ncbi:MAG TPA: pyruvate dehydrogenase complex dihydrolipoamide acetyltransferase [Flavipsychrobacter sp.]|nr:pyruvate dehydrogenase complex dihydrolipoamide acetyltransferase [Flavipsychrobacter sp.]
MAEAIRMPLLSDTMKEGVIAAWHKKVGDTVKSDDVIAEVETDKATMEVMPYVDGTLLYIGVEKGKAAKINEIIAIIGKEGEDYKSLLDSNAGTPEAEPAPPAESQQEAPPAAATASAETEKTVPATTPAPTATAGDATVIRMPLLSDTMKEGKIVAWHKKVGDAIKSDDVLADVETDKATMEVMPYADGTLLYVGVKEGEAAQVNDIIAIVGKAGTDVQPYLSQPAEPSAAATKPTPAANQEAAPQQSAVTVPEKQDADTAAAEGERVKASPLAKKMAADKGIDINAVKGSGDGGRVIKRDVDSYQPQEAAATTSQPKENVTTASVAPIGQEGHTDYPLSQMRKVIAQRLSDSKFSAPHFYLRMTITMDKAMDARKAINDVAPVKVSFNDIIIKAAAMALRKHPEVNSSWMGESIRQNHHIHIGSAVAIDDGLIVPVIKFADQKSLSQIADESKKLSDRARNKKLQPQEFTGNTFTISNLGMMDIDEFTAIINPPDACILAVGKITATPVVEAGEMVVRNLLKLTLSCDHRVVDGAVGAKFMQTLKAYLENPVMMLV